MATRSSGSVSALPEIKGSFSTKEGYYRRVRASEHSRPSRQPLLGKELSPVQISLVACKGKNGIQEWIAFNSSKELYFYPFEGIGKVKYTCVVFAMVDLISRALLPLSCPVRPILTLIHQIPDLKHPHDKRMYKVPTIPVCHDFNIMTRSLEHLDLIVGFSTGPLQYLHPLDKEAVCAFNEDVSVCMCPLVGVDGRW